MMRSFQISRENPPSAREWQACLLISGVNSERGAKNCEPMRFSSAANAPSPGHLRKPERENLFVGVAYMRPKCRTGRAAYMRPLHKNLAFTIGEEVVPLPTRIFQQPPTRGFELYCQGVCSRIYIGFCVLSAALNAPGCAPALRGVPRRHHLPRRRRGGPDGGCRRPAGCPRR